MFLIKLFLILCYIPNSPFAPLDNAPLTAGMDEPALKEEEGLTLVGQVVHPDCRPVLEFGIVCQKKKCHFGNKDTAFLFRKQELN